MWPIVEFINYRYLSHMIMISVIPLKNHYAGDRKKGWVISQYELLVLPSNYMPKLATFPLVLYTKIEDIHISYLNYCQFVSLIPPFSQHSSQSEPVEINLYQVASLFKNLHWASQIPWRKKQQISFNELQTMSNLTSFSFYDLLNFSCLPFCLSYTSLFNISGILLFFRYFVLDLFFC